MKKSLEGLEISNFIDIGAYFYFFSYVSSNKGSQERTPINLVGLLARKGEDSFSETLPVYGVVPTSSRSSQPAMKAANSMDI